jgi:cation diffusion facilitator family transporter
MAAGARKSVLAALAGNLLIALSKAVAAAVTGSAAMLAESVHSLVDSGNEILLLYGIRRARLPPDEQFPFGHGKEIYFWSFVVAVLIFAFGAGLAVYEGVHHLRHPAPARDFLVNYAVIGVSFLFEGASWCIAMKELGAAKGRRSYLAAIHMGKDPSLFAVVLEDSAALAGLLLALAGLGLAQATGEPYWDGLASILIGVLLGVVALWLARESKSLLIGESADPKVVAGIRKLIQGNPDVERVDAILTLHMGPDFVLVNISIRVAKSVDRARVHQLFDAIDKAIKHRYPEVRRVFIESTTALVADT